MNTLTRIVMGDAGGEPAPLPGFPAGAAKLLYLLQVAGANFPTGAFNHSAGFESLIEWRKVDSAAGAEAACSDWLRYSVATSDAAAVAEALRLARVGDLAGLARLDALVGALKSAREAREASAKTGRAFLKAMRDVFGRSRLAIYDAQVTQARTGGHLAVAFGVAAVDFELDEREAVLAFLTSSFGNLVAVVARLVPLGQVETQRILARAWDLIIECTALAVSLRPEDYAAAFAALDVAAMRHERLHTRLCMS